MTGLGSPTANTLIPDLVAYNGSQANTNNTGVAPISAAGLTLDPSYAAAYGAAGAANAFSSANAFSIFDAEMVTSPTFANGGAGFGVSSPFASTGVTPIVTSSTPLDSGFARGGQDLTPLAQPNTNMVAVVEALANTEAAGSLNLASSSNGAENLAGDIQSGYTPDLAPTTTYLLPSGSFNQGSEQDTNDELFAAVGRGLPIGQSGADRLSSAIDATAVDVFDGEQYSPWETKLAGNSLFDME